MPDVTCPFCDAPRPPAPRTLCDACRNRVAADNLALAGWLCHRVRRRHALVRRLEHDDALQVARLGLLEAAGRWDPARGTLATVAAWWVRQHLQRASVLAFTVTLPQTATGGACQATRESVRSVWDARVRAAQAGARSLDQPVESSGGRRRADALPARPERNAALERADFEAVLARARLSGRDRRVLRRRFVDGASLRQLGRELGMTHQGAGEVVARALRALRAAYGEAA